VVLSGLSLRGSSRCIRRTEEKTDGKRNTGKKKFVAEALEEMVTAYFFISLLQKP
jgi:hypothetical protein